MRILLFYDLPMNTNQERKIYTKFRKFLINEGFIQMQESCYTKLVLNNSVAKLQIERVRKSAPSKGLIQVLIITEKQFASIEYITGSNTSISVQSQERLIIL